jgi:hypothetical protein
VSPSNLASSVQSQSAFLNNTIQNNNFIGKSSSAAMIHSTNALLLIESNSLLYNGNFEFGLPVFSVNNGAAIIQKNTFN